MIDLAKYKIVRVLDWFDEVERDCPWNYIQQRDDGRYEAIATHLCEYIHATDHSGEAKERSVGAFDTCEAAEKALRDYLRRVEIADNDRIPRTPDGRLDFNAPTIH